MKMMGSFLNKVHTIYKLLFCLAIALVFFLSLLTSHFNWVTQFLISWDVFSFLLLAFYWLSFFTTSVSDIQKYASIEDASRMVIFTIILFTVLASLVSVVLLITTKTDHLTEKKWDIPVAFLGMVLSWFLLHTIFTVRYAHIFYGNQYARKDHAYGGIDFPKNADNFKPDFLDFAYFSFVLGMTFQVSDVQITSPRIRRLALIHGLLSFGYNMVVVALTINVIANLGGSR
ncbi:MAG: DUF1345 domain-containing protein [Bacteroidetes bacterium]|nr:DUF1345 domain-containing protein [Bacteroidota bacterium]